MDYNVSQILITIACIIIGYMLTLEQNKRIKKKDVKVKYLIEAWRKLEHAANRKDNRYSSDIENAIAEIQLFGSKHQVELAWKFAEEMSRNPNGSLTEILEALRADLRKELGLKKASKGFKFLRFPKSN